MTAVRGWWDWWVAPHPFRQRNGANSLSHALAHGGSRGSDLLTASVAPWLFWVPVRGAAGRVAPLAGRGRNPVAPLAPRRVDQCRRGEGRSHHCLGAQMARLELQIGLGTLLGRFPDLELDIDATEVRWQRGRRQRGPVRLPLTWTTALPAP